MSRTVILKTFRFLAKELKRNGFCLSVKPLLDAENMISSTPSHSALAYNIDTLVLKIGKPRNTLPKEVKYCEAVLDMSIREGIPDKKLIKDNIESYSFAILLRGIIQDEKKYVCARWHLDADNDGNDHVHPKYHLTFGGNEMENAENILMLKSPRLPHPPMDCILGIDFILRHFVRKELCSNIIEHPTYQQGVREAHERLWRPYYTAISNYWCRCNQLTIDKRQCFEYLPMLVDDSGNKQNGWSS